MTESSASPARSGGDSPRGRLLAAAAHLFRTRGFERTTVRDLAQAVGIQSGSIFHHFKSKEEILRCVMEEVIRFNTLRMEQGLAAADSPRNKLLALLRSELTAINGDTGEAMAVLIFEWRSLTPESQEYLLDLRAHYERLWLDTLAEAQRAGLIAEHRDLFVLRRFLAGATGWSHYWYRPDGTLDIEKLARQALYLVIPE
ncbi:MAG: TetR/AcrR family transcriptional regulator [Pseudomonadota bacterium]|nr:TetR family transcriptional regulator [Pseudomonadales bacterium]MDY6921390.1 TetR/AcrR family transcriptional regulator [Pseudomonadota bacterium]